MIEHINYAREWLGTPFHSQASLKGIGVDCSGMVIDSLIRAGMINPLRRFPYQLGRASNDGEIMTADFTQSIKPGHVLIEANDIQPGDILFFEFIKKIRHVSIATSETTHIHTSAIDLRGVIETVITDGFLSRLKIIYRILEA